ncbi:non-ribosomal peptide synthetase [Pseudomonas putida]|uniref:non-ribosomal peptide synthetase n=1 Tax=Pseudomonas putida TaxID=303 RepID=UPI0009539A12|nr:non-ribosomal peptide synthetase [Pseudomonas putida]USX34574.1 non-ribosomal peptide synthetase [Pseudomonas putida]SIR91538.1 non-ribosomal peptide synthase domain TIGR01720/amino acid adenylation domain-containing protein [Pseudomonas putida]
MNAQDSLKLARRFIALAPDKRRLFLAALQKEGVDFDQFPIASGVDCEERQSLSYAQQRMWFLWQLDPQSGAYNLPAAVRLKGELNYQALQAAFTDLVQRHETLRTVFCQDAAGVLRQVVVEADVTVTQLDLSALAVDEREAQVAEEAQAQSLLPFDLEQGPLLRVRLLVLDAQEHVLLLTMHHVVSDGWSMGIIIDEFVRCYEARCQGQAPQLAPLPVQYADYALWQRSWMDAGEQERQLDYWRAQLGDEQPVLELPLDFVRPAVASHQGQRLELDLPQALADDARQFARQHNVSLFTLLLATFNVLLWRYTGQTSLRIGVPIANRNRPEVEGLVGLFVNTQVMAGELDGQHTVDALLQALKGQVNGAQAHQDLPFERLVEAVRPERSLSHSPLFQVMYNHQPQVADLEQLQLASGLALSTIQWQARTTQFDLSLDTWEKGGQLKAALTFASDLFAVTTIERMGRHWQRLLQAMIANSHQRLAELPLLEDEDYQRQVHAWNDTASAFDASRCIHHLIAAQAAEQPDATAVLHRQTRLDRQGLEARANRLAHRLIELGVGPEVRVGVAMQRSESLIVALLAVLKAGGAYVPLDPDYPAERVAYMLEDSRAQVLLSETGLLDDLPAGQAQVLLLDTLGDSLAGYPASAPQTTVCPDNLAYVIYTSGSTGKPKGVSISHRNVLALIHWSQQVYGVDDIQGVLASTSVCFDLSVWEIFVTLANGGWLVIARNALELPELEARDQVRLINTVPSAINALQRAGQIPPGVRIVNLAGEPLKQALVDALYEQPGLAHVYDLYGPSEDTTYSTWARREAGGQANIGRPLHNTRAYILDGHLQPVPSGLPGELLLAGDGLTRGYLGRPGLTAERYVPDPFSTTGERLYRTGDLARYGDAGVIRYVGRIDHQVKIRGLRIELGEIEARLQAHGEIKEALAVAQDGRLLVAYVVAHQLPADPAAFDSVLRAHLAQTLPDYMLPTAIVALAEMPTTPNGKVDRKALPRVGEVQKQTFSAAQTPRQIALAQIWQDILGIPEVGLDDNFFELGGDSIVSIQVVSRARQAGLRLLASDLFRYQTIRVLAEVVTELAASHAEQALVQGPVLLTPVQRWFFEQDIPARHHWNQSLLLTAREPVQVDALNRALQALVAQHDALRLRFTEDRQGWKQWHAPLAAPELWQRRADSAEQLRALCDAAQTSLNLEQGPLLRAMLVDMADGSQRLLLVLHHLVVDGVSWRVLLEDLQQDYASAVAGQALMPRYKTSSYQQWAACLVSYAGSASVLAELPFWREQLHDAPGDLPLDNPAGRHCNAMAQRLSLRLSRPQTQQLLQQAPAAYRTQVNDLLLTAVARVICRWSAAPAALIQLEGHGREELFDDIDLTRTLGWFTSLYPLKLTPAADLGAAIKGIKEQLRQVPNKGIGYGLLRQGEAAAELAALAQPRITFNYLGQFDQQFDAAAAFVPAHEGSGQAQSLQAPLANWLTIEGRVYAGELELDFGYSSEAFHSATIKALVDACERELLAIIEHCLDPAHSGVTPSDFPLANLDQAQLNALQLPLAGIDNLYPLSPMQQGMLFHSTYSAQAGVYVNQMCLTMDGLDVERFRNSWQAVLERHEVLRARFIWDGLAAPLQVIERHAELPFEVRQCPAGQLQTLAQAQREQGFDLAQAPLLRLVLVPLGEQRYELIYTSHHILMDGWSNALLLGEVLQRYHGQQPAGHASDYRDYIAWLQRQDRAASEAFWRGQLAELHEPTRLAGALRVTPGQGQGEHLQVLDALRTQALSRFAMAQKVTFNTLLQAAWALLLQRYTGQASVCFGATVSGRPAELAGIEQQIGLFINTLPLIVSPCQEQPLGQYLQQLQVLNLALREQEHTPLFDIQRWAGRGGEGLFDTLLVFENYPVAEVLGQQAGSGLSFGGLSNHEQTNYPLTLAVGLGDTLSLQYSYDRAHFDQASIEQVATHLALLLERMSQSPDLLLGALALVDDAEVRQQHGWNLSPSAFDASRCIHHLIAAQAAEQPDATAVLHRQTRLDRQGLEARANRLAHRLIELGVGPEVRVGVAMQRSESLIVALLAVLKAGGAYVPLDPDYPAERVAYMLEDSRAQVLLSETGLLDDLPAGQAQVLLLDTLGDSLAGYPASAPQTTVCPDNLAYVIYTSGSTGKPKGVSISHRNVLALIHWSQQVYGVDDIQGVLASTSVCFDLSVWEIFVTLANGGWLVIARNALELPELEARDQVRLINTVPSAINALQRAGQIPPGVRIVNLAGEPLKQALVDALYEQPGLAHVYDLYGPSEDTTYSTWARREAGGQANIGRPLHNTQGYLLDHQLHAVPAGACAELYLAGAGITRGYLLRPGLTAERYVPNPFGASGERLYRTGDLARYGQDGVIEYVGRIDHQVKIRGFRVELGEIEARLQQHASVCEVAVIAQQGEHAQQLVAYVVPSQAGLATAEQPLQTALREHLARHLRASLAEYMVPGFWVLLDQLPLTPNGKLDRKALPDPAGYQGRQAYVAPVTSEQQQLAHIWQSVLKVPRIGLSDNFFELGGDSILSMQVVSRARRVGLHFTAKQLFEQQTVQGLTAVLQQGQVLATIDQGPVTGSTPLLPIQQAFFQQQVPQRHQWNQSVLLVPQVPLDAALLAQALRAVVMHHDALRLTFAQQQGLWQAQHAQAVSDDLLWQREVADEQQERALLDQAQASLALEHGPLLRAVLLQRGDGSQRLLMAVHHLVVDGVSWRILLEDVQLAYRQLAQGQAVVLPAKTSAFRTWAERLQALAQSAELQQQMVYWQQLQGLPTDLPGAKTNACPRNDEAVTLNTCLSAPLSRRLLQEAPAAYRTQVNDLLLAALARVISRWTGLPDVLVQLEGHGREALFDDIDLTRSVGWFTSLFPVRLTPAPQMGASIMRIKEQLRAVPLRGIGFGVLSSFGSAEQRQALAALPTPRITFNYLGQFDGSFDAAQQALFAPSGEFAGHEQSADAPLGNWLTLNGQVYGGELRLGWTFSRQMFDSAAIGELAKALEAELQALVEHCTSGAQGVTPSDVPLAELDQVQLDALALAAEGLEDLYPLSPMQQGMLFHSLYPQSAGDYLNQMQVTIDGLEPERFRDAWQATLDAHDILRTSFHWHDGLERPLQQVHKRVEVPFSVLDWRDRDATNEALLSLADSERSRGFVLDQPGLLRLLLVRVGQDRYRLIYTHHHILIDGWSNSQLLGEVLQRYAGQPPAQAPGRYRDYIGWLQRQDAHAAQTFWQVALAPLQEPTRLAQVQAKVPEAGQGELLVQLDAGQTSALADLARLHRVTVNTVLQAAWLMLLQRHTGQRSVAFGATVAGRPAELPGIEQQVGLFINTLPVIGTPCDECPLGQWLEAVQAFNLSLREHAHTPLYDLHRWAGHGGEGLFDSILIFENYPVAEALGRGAPAGLAFDEVGSVEQTHYPLSLYVSQGQALELHYRYDRAHLASDAVARINQHLLTLLAGMLQAPNAMLGDLPMLEAAQQCEVLGQWTAPVTAYPEQNIARQFEAQAQANPDAAALVFGEQTLSYRELNAQANRLAHCLRAQGVGPDQLVGLAVDRGLSMIISLLAILKAGGAYVPLDPSYPQERLAYMMADSGLALLLTQGHLQAALPTPPGVSTLLLDAQPGWLDSYPAHDLPPLTAGDNLAYVIYTSGSTGKPKGVMVPHDALANFIASMARQPGLEAGQRILSLTTFSFDIFGLEIYLPLSVGACAVLVDKDSTLDPQALLRIIAGQRVDAVQATPSTWRMLLDSHERDALCGCTLLCGGEALADELAARMLEVGASVWNLYGPTETTIWSALHRLDPVDGQPWLGRPIANTALYILTADGALAPLGVPGELLIGGEGLARGYLRRPGLTAERFLPNPFGAPGERLYRTGDLACYRAEGVVEYLGRLDHQVKIRGFRIELGEIEAQLLAQSSVREAAVVAVDKGHGPQLVGYVVPSEPCADADAQASLREALGLALKQQLADYMVPAHLLVLAQMPLTPNGKLDRKALPAPDASQAQRSYQAPRNDLEAQLVQIWQAVLKLDQVGVHDNFFDLGGHSLQVVVMLARVRAQLGVEVAVKDFYALDSLEALARSLEDTAQTTGDGDFDLIFDALDELEENNA